MNLDFHEHSLEEAKEAICYSLEECKVIMDETLEINHGHKHGTAIRDYIRSDDFLNDIAQIGILLTSKNFTDDWRSIIQLKLPISNDFEKTRKVAIPKTNDYICHKCNQIMIPVEGLSWIKCPICGKYQKR